EVVDAERLGVGARGIVDGSVGAAAIEETVRAADVVVSPDDLARVVDAECGGATWPRQGVVEGSVGAAVIEEAVVYGADAIRTGDLARIVDAVGLGPRRRGNVERCVGAGTIEEAVITADPIIPDDQAPIVDTLRGGEWARWIVEG